VQPQACRLLQHAPTNRTPTRAHLYPQQVAYDRVGLRVRRRLQRVAGRARRGAAAAAARLPDLPRLLRRCSGVEVGGLSLEQGNGGQRSRRGSYQTQHNATSNKDRTAPYQAKKSP